MKKIEEFSPKFRELFNRASDAMYLWDVKEDGSPGLCLEVNNAACNMLGYSKKEFLNMTPQNIDDIISAEKIPQVMNQLKAEGHSTFEMVHLAKDGKEIPVEISSHLFTMLDREVILSISRDISDRKQVEGELRKYQYHLKGQLDKNAIKLTKINKKLRSEISERQKAEKEINQQNKFLNSIIESLPHPFYVINTKDYLVKIANPAANKTGISINLPCYSLTHKRDAPCGSKEHPCPLEQLKNTKKPVSVEHLHYDGNGDLRIFEVNGFPVLDHKGEIFQMIVYSQDITDRKIAEEQIKASLKEKEVLLEEIHHRVKNNLQIMYSLISIQSEYIENEKYKKTFKDFQNQIMSMALVHEILYKTKDLTKIDLKKYIENLLQSLFASYGIKASKITATIEVESAKLGVDTVILCGLIINELVSNSLKYAFPDNNCGKIRIALHAKGKTEFEMMVSDNGIGLPKYLNPEKTESFGLQMVNVLVKGNLHGDISLNRTGGTEYKISFNTAEK
jgi:PAS domain S-box-containing protein